LCPTPARRSFAQRATSSARRTLLKLTPTTTFNTRPDHNCPLPGQRGEAFFWRSQNPHRPEPSGHNRPVITHSLFQIDKKPAVGLNDTQIQQEPHGFTFVPSFDEDVQQLG